MAERDEDTHKGNRDNEGESMKATWYQAVKDIHNAFPVNSKGLDNNDAEQYVLYVLKQASGGIPMKKAYRVILMVLIILLPIVVISIVMAQKTEIPLALNGIRLPDGYKNWRLISSTHRTDNNTLRVILGNDIAVQAARSGSTNPWPDGSILAKLVWKDATHEQWPTATIPGALVHAEFMIKDAKKYAATGGWGFARWLGMEQKPYGKDADFVQECYSCHIPMKHNDYVFTHPAITP